MKPLTYGQLPRRPRYGVALHCLGECEPNDGFSADRSDYFMRHDADPVLCTCGAPMALFQRVVSLKPVTPERAEART